MKFFIDSHALECLVDPDVNVRVKTLNEITSILRNNILFEAAASQGNNVANDELEVINLDELTRQLIRWFIFRPIIKSEEILDLLILIFSRKDFLRYITKSISVQRLKKEMIKIAKMQIPDTGALKLVTIDQLLSDFELETLINIANETGSIARDEINSLESNFIDRVNRLQIVSSVSSVECDDAHAIEVTKEFWIQLRGKELDIFNTLDEELLLYNNQETFKKALNFLQVSLEDFPSEYFLQPPYMLETLMDILWKVLPQRSIEIVKIIRFITNGLRDRLKEAKSKLGNYIPTKKHMNKILQVFTIFFEHFHREFDHKLVADKQEILNHIFMFLFDLIKLIRDSQEFCEIFLNEFLNMLAKVVKDFRLADTHTSFNCRLNYLISLYLLNVFLASADTSNFHQFGQNNVWEYECDVALLDFKLKSRHEEIYKLIMKNRYEVIKDDTDLELLLDIETLWKRAAQIFQNHETLSEKYIIENASYTMDVIRVLKNTKFVDVVFNAIVNSSYRFHVDKGIQQTSSEIFLRLVSIDVPEIKLRAYSLARESVQKRISEDCNDPNLKDVDLCAIVGIPMNTEIITEIICFGLMDGDLEVQKNATMILFALLRGKVVFPNHWEAILEIMKPVLAMLPCLFSKEPKLGFFALDIYNQYSGFTGDELNQAYARFLFCSHPNAREMAKRKLLENLQEYSNDFIEIVPDNFCILPHGLITALSIPDKSIGYDREAYATTAQLLKSPSTHNDPEILQSILLQLSVLMNSAKLCEKAHDDNLWIYFMASLDMNYPNNHVIRKLTINILYKWTVTVPFFRIYLANEPKALHFIINTLIYYQDDLQIRKQASSFLFLILFSDFVVVNENATSLPNILSTLECPFIFTKHWQESPFNKISQIEWLYDSIENDEDRDSDIREITRNYFRFTFANTWFQSKFIGYNENSYYEDKYEKALKVPAKIMLVKKDFESLQEAAIPNIVDKFINNLSNLTNTSEMTILTQQVIGSLMLPNMKIERFSTTLDAHLREYSCYKLNTSNPRKIVFIKLLELYQHIIPSLSDTRIINMMREKPIESFIMSTELLEDDEVIMPILCLINNVIKISTKKKDLGNKIIKRYSDELKVYFPSCLIEKLIAHVFEHYVKPRMLNDVRALPAIKVILTTIKNIFTYFPVILDEQFINSLFQDMLAATKFFLSTPRTAKDNGLETIRHSSTHVIYLMHSIIERLCALSCHINLKPDNFNVIFLWLSDEERRNNALMWKIVAQLTKRNLHFNEFCKGFDESMKMSFYDVVTQAIASSERIFNCDEKNAQALVVGNFLEYICEENAREIGLKNSRKTAMEIKQDIATLFMDKKPHSIDAICFVIKRMLNSKKDFNVEEMVKQKRLVAFLLKYSIENLDTVVSCYKFQALKGHVQDILNSMNDETFYQLIANIKCPYDKSSQKKINKNLLSIILIFLQSQSGHEKACKVITKDRTTFNNFIINIFNGLQSENSFNEIMFQFELISSLLNFNSDIFTSDVNAFVCGEKLNQISGNFAKPEINLPEKFVKYLKLVQYAVDLLVIQIVALFESLDVMRFNSENKYDMRAQIFLTLKKLMSSSEQARIIASKIDLMGIVLNRVKIIVQSIGNTTRIEMNKKSGVQKCQYISKEICMNLKAIVEWNLACENTETIEEFLAKVLSVYGWIYNDTLLLNAFINFLQRFDSLRFAKICLAREHNGKSVLKGILKKAFELSSNQHTDVNLALLRNILNLFATYANVIDVRLMLKNANIFQILDIFHPQLQKSRKTAWNEVTLLWLKFFEKLSLIEDPECNPNQISLFCRLIRTDDKEIGKTTLKIIRNVSMKSHHGYAILQSNDFLETVSSILCNDGKNENEKILILQTLLGLASKSEQMRSKLKNSSFSRKLKDYLASMQVNENLQIFNLTTMLSDILYPH